MFFSLVINVLQLPKFISWMKFLFISGIWRVQFSLTHIQRLANLYDVRVWSPTFKCLLLLGPVALLEFRIWKQGRVNCESLTQKLQASVRHAIWDLLMEFHLLTAPLGVLCPSTGHTSPTASPTVALSASPSPSTTTISPSITTFLPLANSEPSTPSKGWQGSPLLIFNWM